MNDFNFSKKFSNWLEIKKWKLFDYQKEFFSCLSKNKYKQYIISSDTGTGKTITSFLPFLNYFCKGIKKNILYISPLKSINSNLENNLKKVIFELNINCKVEKRTSDVPSNKKKKQLFSIPDFLLTTPESFTLMIANPDALNFLENIDYVIIDEITELFNEKRGDQLSLSLSKLNSINKKFVLIGLSATVSNFKNLNEWISFKGKTKLISNKKKKKIKIDVLYSKKIPLVGHSPNFAIDIIKRKIINKKTIIFVNTRSQSELLHNELLESLNSYTRVNIHHGSLSAKHRNEVEDNFSKGKLDVIVSTSSLELGIDWDHVDQVILIGTPKNINRLIQRTGRSNHNHQGIAKSFLIPTNQFEYLECISAKKLAEDMKFESLPRRTGAKDVLCQHLLLLACGKGFCPKNTYSEVIKASPYRSLPFDEYIKILEFIKNGGYVLNNYKRWNKIYLTPNGLYKINSLTNRIKTLVNIGTIIDNTNIKIVLNTGKTLGHVDESFLTTLKKGDYFIFSGLNLICLQISSEIILVKKINKKINKTPIYWGGNLPLSENLSNEIFKNLHNISNLPDEIKQFIKHQKSLSTLPKKNEILIEKFPYGEGIYLCFYTFLGRQTNHSFCLFFIEFLKKKKILAYDYTIEEYSFAIFLNERKSLSLSTIKTFFSSDELFINILDTFIAKKTFREISLISGLIEKKNKNKKNYVNSDIIFDTLKKYDPNHILLKITREEVKRFFCDKAKINLFLNKKLIFRKLDKPSPFSMSLIYKKERIKSHTTNKDEILNFFNTYGIN